MRFVLTSMAWIGIALAFAVRYGLMSVVHDLNVPLLLTFDLVFMYLSSVAVPAGILFFATEGSLIDGLEARTTRAIALTSNAQLAAAGLLVVAAVIRTISGGPSSHAPIYFWLMGSTTVVCVVATKARQHTAAVVSAAVLLMALVLLGIAK